MWGEQWESLQNALPEALCSKLSEIVLAHGSAIAWQLEGAMGLTECSAEGAAEAAEEGTVGENDRESSRGLHPHSIKGALLPTPSHPKSHHCMDLFVGAQPRKAVNSVPRTSATSTVARHCAEQGSAVVTYC